ncbi:MAG: phosphate ABC transporter permease family protein, partial [Gammaproteobacteria bacterium]|nr:phosphate ABC transporter permease family protein [Gammaproteobacteria bacterium]
MQGNTLILILAATSVVAFFMGRARSLKLAGAPRIRGALHSLPGYYGYFTAIWCLLPALLVLSLWLSLESRLIIALLVEQLPAAQQALSAGELNLLLNNIQNLANGDAISGTADAMLQDAASRYSSYMIASRRLLAVVTLAVAGIGGVLAWRRVHPALRARNKVEQIVLVLLVAASSIAILTTIGIVLSVVFEALRFFQKVPLSEFLFGLNWSPQTAIRADQVGSSGSFGALPLFAGTLLITSIAMVVAVPVGLMTAIYLAEYSSRAVRAAAKPLLEILAGIPTVVYGFFAALTVAPWVRRAGEALGLEVASESALAAG